MHSDTQAFIDALFARCHPTSFLTLTALPPPQSHAKQSTPSRHIRLDDTVLLTDTLERLNAANRQGWSAVVGVGTRRRDLGRWKRGAKRDLAELPALFVDIDNSGGDSQTKRDTFLLRPSIRVASGGVGHEHWYWLLDAPTSDMAKVDLILHGLARWLGADPILTRAQAMRLPGTLNPKPDRENNLCHLLELHPERCFSLTQFEPYIVDVEASQRRSSPRPTMTTLHWTKEEYTEMIHAVEHCLLTTFDGFYKPNGWLSAICPCGHAYDRPGMHFGFSAQYAVRHCFGRHLTMILPELCAELRLI